MKTTDLTRLTSAHVHCRLPGMTDNTDIMVLTAQMRRLPDADRLAVIAASDEVFEGYDQISGGFSAPIADLVALACAAGKAVR